MTRVSAIVTTYYPTIKHLNNIKRIASQINRIFICDNSPRCNIELFSEIDNLEYCFWNANLGLSIGFNRILKDEKYSWLDDDYIVFFDQDTVIPENHIMSLVNDYESLTKEGYRVGCIGPVFFNESMQKTEIPKLKKKINDNIIEVRSNITSSMLCRYDHLKTIDFWNEEIFLDMADWDICWRFKRYNMKCFMSHSSIINHTVGEGRKKILGFYYLRIAKPFREYYQIRDCLYLFWKDYIPWNFRVRFLIRLTVRNVLHILFLDNPKLRIKYILKGFNDYFHGVHGEIMN